MLHGVTESWNETSVNWNNKPSKDGGYTDYLSTDGSTGWWAFDATTLIADWADGSRDNYGMTIVSPAGCTLSTIYSSDNSNTTLRPKLTVDYTVNSAVEEATWGQIKADL